MWQDKVTEPFLVQHKELHELDLTLLMHFYQPDFSTGFS